MFHANLHANIITQMCRVSTGLTLTHCYDWFVLEISSGEAIWSLLSPK